MGWLGTSLLLYTARQAKIIGRNAFGPGEILNAAMDANGRARSECGCDARQHQPSSSWLVVVVVDKCVRLPPPESDL